MQTKDIPLHDIKPLIEIQEYSMYYLIALVIAVFVVVLALIYFAYQYFTNRNKLNIKKEHLKLLKSLDMSDTKRVAYEVTQYGATFAGDNDQNERTYKNLVEELESYKYKKNVESFSKETKNSIENYIGMLDV